MIGNIIRIYRVQKGYSQCYMSYRLEISQNAYSKMELGQTEITINRLIKIADILEVPIVTLIDPVLQKEAV